ncbi:MAG: DMT family transporter [Saprospiraceae bacterium]|nr:DMT family transporter [Saprospiraceae bacterium]
MENSKSASTYLAWFLLILLSLVWGSSFILIKKALIAFTPMQVGAGRIVFAFLAFLPFFLRHIRRIDWSKFKWFAVVGLCGSGFPAFLFAIAQTNIDSSIAGVLNSLTPIFTFVLAVLIFKHAFSSKQLAGVVIGFLGVLCIFFTNQQESTTFAPAFALLIIVATLMYAISANTVGRFLKSVDPLIISTVSFVLIGPFVLIYLLGSGFVAQMTSHEAGLSSTVALLILSLVGTFGANILFFKLVQLTDAVFSSSVSFIIPLVALFWGYIDGEHLSLLHFISLLLILFGVLLIKRSTQKQLLKS